MTVKISKSALNLREELADLRKPSGIAGEALLRADSVQDVRDTINAGRKNLVMNGDFQVWQRGTSFGTGSGFKADRWYLNASSGVTVDRHSLTAGEAKGLSYACKLTGTGTDSNRQFHHKIEGLKQFSGKQITLSFYAKADAQMTLEPQYGLLGAGNDSYVVWDSIEVGTEWARYQTTVTIPDLSSGYNFGGSACLRVCFNLKKSSYELYMTGVQLELGSVATEFEHRSYGEELALCQRFYYTNSANYDYAAPIATQQAFRVSYIPFPQTMRVSPTISGLTYGGNQAIAPNVTEPNKDGVSFTWNSFAGGDFVRVQSINADAEL